MNASAWILTQKLELFLKKIAKIAKRGASLACAVHETEFRDVTYYDYELEGDVTRSIPFTRVELTGESAKYDGWKFVASVERPEEGEDNLLFAAPGETVPEEFRKVSNNRCDHCKHSRKRKYHILVAHEEHGHKLIGTSCMQDYLGKEAHHIVGQAAYITQAYELLEDPDFMTAKQYSPNYMETREFLMHVFSNASKHGYEKYSTIEGGPSTCEVAESDYWNGVKTDAKYTDDVTKAIEWMLTNEQDNDYIHNMKVALKQSYTTDKTKRLVCSLYPSYQRQLDYERKQARREEMKKTAQPFPETEDRMTITGIVISFKSSYDYYDNLITKVLVEDDRGFRVFGSLPSAISSAEVGDKIQFDAKLNKQAEDFGFFSRPTKAQIIERANETVSV